MKRPNRNKTRKAERQVSAAERNAAGALLTPAQKLARLDARLGAGVGALRERTRLQKLAAAGSKPVVTKATAEAVFGVAETRAELAAKKGKGPRHGKPVARPA